MRDIEVIARRNDPGNFLKPFPVTGVQYRPAWMTIDNSAYFGPYFSHTGFDGHSERRLVGDFDESRSSRPPWIFPSPAVLTVSTDRALPVALSAGQNFFTSA